MTSLKPFHTFATDADCQQLVTIYSGQDLFRYLTDREANFMILGGVVMCYLQMILTVMFC
ncbi:MAG: hypothetical protein IPH36_12295 [Saprospiraceae bacterium]|nr:hypothetical protein [Saprospiraceae bacterium]